MNKYLLSFCIAFPLLSSCTVVQEQYYEPGYYPPPPAVEVHRYYPETSYDGNRHYHAGYRPAPRGRVYHGHGNQGGTAVVVNPRPSQPRFEVQPNVHGHANTNPGVRPQVSGTPAPTQGNEHGHSNNAGAAPRSVQPAGASAQVPQQAHGHS